MVPVIGLASAIIILISILPFVRSSHWVFRSAEFIKQQILVVQILIIILTFLFIESHPWLWYVQIPQIILMVYHIWLLAPYTRLTNVAQAPNSKGNTEIIKLIFFNVQQSNQQFDRFIHLIERESPDLILTMESNSDWERAMRKLETEYPTFKKVTLENTYGMHFYTRLKTHQIRTHYFVSDDIPSIEAELETSEGRRFRFFGVHPPPPSPTEEENSLERDGDLLSVAKRIKNVDMPVIAAGDFNNVAWARSSILFRKASGLVDARIGRKILSSFHTKYWFFRVPLDLLFHSPNIVVDKLFRYPDIGSDHFPIGCCFHITDANDQNKDPDETLDVEEEKEIDQAIEAGKEEESDQRSES